MVDTYSDSKQAASLAEYKKGSCPKQIQVDTSLVDLPVILGY